jgi:DNA polymerase-3 subunit delta
MQESIPTIYLFYGTDELALAEEVQSLHQRLGDQPMADLNTQRFAAANVDLPTLEAACAAVPFLTKRRLVILENPTAFIKTTTSEEFFAFLQRVPSSTALVLLEPQDLGPKKHGAKPSPLLLWAQEHRDIAHLEHRNVPSGPAFVRWIEQRCQELGGAITHHAAEALAEASAYDPQTAQTELEKLLDYTNYQRDVQPEDVEALTPLYGQAGIFALVDAIGERNAQQALSSLQDLLESEPALVILSMIVRQFRLLLVAREALDARQHPHQALRPHTKSAFVMNKIARQARNFRLADLKQVYQRLFDLDWGSKTSQRDLPVALEALVADLTRPRA